MAVTSKAQVRGGPDPALPLLSFTGEGPVDLDRLLSSRLLLEAGSGGGKSRALRQLLEQTHGRVPQIVFDWEGEFSSLREVYPYIYAAAKGGDVAADVRTAPQLCRRVVELGASIIIDLYDLAKPARREYARRFLDELMGLPKQLWRPFLVVLDEGHELAPEGGHGESVALQSVVDLTSKGRKRGFCAVIATQRIGKLSKDAAADLQNKLIGLTTLDTDVKRAGEDLGFDKAARHALTQLQPGEFFAVGPAISRAVVKVRTGAVRTTHPEAGKVAAAPPPPSASIRALLEQFKDLPQEAETRERTVEALEKQVRQLRAELARKPPAPVAPLPPKPVEVSVLGDGDRAHLDRLLGGIWGDVKGVAAALEPLQQAFQRAVGNMSQVGQLLEALAAKRSAATPAPRMVVTELPRRPHAPHPSAASEPHHPRAEPAEGLSAPQQRILNVLADFEGLGLQRPQKSPVAVFSGASPTSSAYANNLGKLRSLGLIEYGPGGTVGLTPAGRALAVTEGRPLTTAELHDAWREKLPAPQWAILAALIARHPAAVARDELAGLAGASPTSSAYQNNLGSLRGLGLLDYGPGRTVVATDMLFLGGGR